jgi:hypothetical protein
MSSKNVVSFDNWSWNKDSFKEVIIPDDQSGNTEQIFSNVSVSYNL